MKNSVSTIIIFGFIFILVLATTFYYQNKNKDFTKKDTSSELSESSDENTQVTFPKNDEGQVNEKSEKPFDKNLPKNESKKETTAEDNNTIIEKNVIERESDIIEDSPVNNDSGTSILSDQSLLSSETLIPRVPYYVATNETKKESVKISEEDPLAEIVKKMGEQFGKDAQKIKKEIFQPSDNSSIKDNSSEK